MGLKFRERLGREVEEARSRAGGGQERKFVCWKVV